MIIGNQDDQRKKRKGSTPPLTHSPKLNKPRNSFTKTKAMKVPKLPIKQRPYGETAPPQRLRKTFSRGHGFGLRFETSLELGLFGGLSTHLGDGSWDAAARPGVVSFCFSLGMGFGLLSGSDVHCPKNQSVFPWRFSRTSCSNLHLQWITLANASQPSARYQDTSRSPKALRTTA